MTWRQYEFQKGREPRAGYVYLWCYAPSAMVKIGFSNDPHRRLLSEQSRIRLRQGFYGYVPLAAEWVKLVAAIPGTEADEARLQEEFPALRVPGSE